MSSIGLKLVRAAFSASERIAPRTGGRAAFELFCRTANPAKPTPGERRAVERAAPFMAGARRHFLPVGKSDVVVHEFRPVGESLGKVLVTHGWRSRTEYMRAPIEALISAGYHVYSLDFPGHGASPGRRLDLKIAVQSVKAASDWFGPFFAIVGHSFGGAVAVNAAAGSIEGIDAVATARIVTIASPSVMGDVFAGFGGMIGLGPRTQAALEARVQQIAGRPLTDFQSGALLSRMPIETLVIHAHDDREVSPRHAELVAKAGKHVTLEWHEGLGHRRIVGDTDVCQSVVRFASGRLTERLAA